MLQRAVCKILTGPDDGGSRHLCNVGQYLHGATSQKTAIFILVPVKTSNLI
jgi:hypothetical protein